METNERKKLNNKVEFTGCGKSIVMRMSDHELRKLRVYSEKKKDSSIDDMKTGYIRNFSLYALFDYAIKSRSKCGRIRENFPYHDFELMYWTLL